MVRPFPLRRNLKAPSGWRPSPGCNRKTQATDTHMAKVAFLALGVMGLPMAGHLVTKGGHEVTVYHTTASAEVARELDAAATKAGFKFIDAPVSGGQAGAENGVLTVMCGGAQDDYAGAEPIITGAYARMCKLLGPAGSGQLTKMVNQICIAGLVQGLSE